ncbi:MAG: TaqI-like C-terminal specificity domain-containing protein [Candidatus Saccharimonadales bacterium]
MASLFGKNKLRDIATKLQTSDLEDKIAIVKTWHNDYHKGSLKADKETSREQAYNHDFFIKILGYKEKPTVPYSFEPKATTDKGQLPDAVLSHTDVTQDIKNIAAVVELKGASIELDRPQRREGNMSPVQQGFKYKTQYRNCPFVVVSNFWEFRLYHDNQLDYELWTLDDLVDPDDDYLKFKTFYTLLHSDNLTTPKGASKTEGWLSDIRYEQEEIGKKFYKMYREARLDLLRDIYRHNQTVRSDIDMGIEKAQKIIDRIVFACFAEDRGLLPDNTLQRVIQAADKSAFGGSLWSTFKAFFEAIDVGSEKLEIPDGYNGGLFAHDPTLNALKVSDEPLRKVANISNYNFEEDLSVTILGHIFEQSISDLEEIKSKVEETKSLDSFQQSRRKKDGIFYTPDYIVRYIVDNSLGAYLRGEEERLKSEFKLKGDITDKNYEKRERQAYSKYQEFLQNVKVVDPACGSGAFLVYVFDYLLAENKRVASILGNNLFSSEDYIKSILQNNIYGVDLNDESVEITKLSLWLKSAQKGKKLTTLDNNIKCGNSLIDDSEVAGDKAFVWEKEFPEIFAKGGFDIVVGNPPWVFTREGGFTQGSKDFISAYIENKSITTESRGLNIQKGKINLYAVFIAKGLDLLTKGGVLSYIVPNSILRATPYEAFRKYLLDNFAIKQIVNLGAGIFSGVTASSVILSIGRKEGISSNYETEIIIDIQNPNEKSRLEQNNFSNNASYVFNILAKKEEVTLTTKILSNHIVLGNIAKFISPGIDGDKSKYVSKERLSDDYKPLLFGKSFGRYTINFDNNYILYDRSKLNRARKEEIFTSDKIIIQRISGGLNPLRCTLDVEQFYTFNSVNNVILKDDSGVSAHYVLALLNSRLLNWYYSTNFSNKSTLTVNISKTFLEKLPIAIGLKGEQDSLEKLTKKILSLYSKQDQVLTRIEKVILSEYQIEKWPTKLNKWWLIDFATFVKTLKITLTLSQKDELMILYEKYRKELLALEQEIKNTDYEINQSVYSLYGLTNEEIEIIDKQTNE